MSLASDKWFLLFASAAMIQLRHATLADTNQIAVSQRTHARRNARDGRRDEPRGSRRSFGRLARGTSGVGTDRSLAARIFYAAPRQRMRRGHLRFQGTA